jgi:ABC-type polar amino acid transport system ATPase subunit
MQTLARGGMTMIVVTHEMDFARQVCDRVVFMDKGQIVEAGEPDVVFRRPADPRTQQFLSRVLHRLGDAKA